MPEHKIVIWWYLVKGFCPVIRFGCLLANGGSFIAAPDGQWIIEPVTDKECLLTATSDIKRVWEERQNFDAVGHYSRPDVTQLILNRERQTVLKLK